jgi:hypothetical protein
MNQESKVPILSIIDQYLKDGLLENLGEDEQRYQYLEETVTSLVKRIEEDSSLLIQFSLVAFQPKPSVDEPEIIVVYETLKVYWKFIDNVYRQDRPITLLKAIMLESISRLCNSDGRIASIIYHANASAVSHYKYDQKEGSLIKQVLTTAAIKAEEFAVNHYISSTEIREQPIFDVKITSSEEINVDQDALQDGLFAAAGPADEQGNVPKHKSPNPYQVNSHPTYWSKPFSNIASESIAQSIKSSIENALSEFANDASTVISEKLQEVAGYINYSKTSNFAIETKMLWWMQSLYSPKLQSSYRDLPLQATIISMANDLFDIVSVPIPESVVFILGEAILNAISDFPAKNRKAVKLSEWLSNLKQSDVLNAIEPLAIHSSNIENHTQPLIAVVRAVLNGQNVSKEMLGDLLDVVLTPRQFGMWLFRDLVAEGLVKEHDHE